MVKKIKYTSRSVKLMGFYESVNTWKVLFFSEKM